MNWGGGPGNPPGAASPLTVLFENTPDVWVLQSAKMSEGDSWAPGSRRSQRMSPGWSARRRGNRISVYHSGTPSSLSFISCLLFIRPDSRAIEVPSIRRNSMSLTTCPQSACAAGTVGQPPVSSVGPKRASYLVAAIIRRSSSHLFRLHPPRSLRPLPFFVRHTGSIRSFAHRPGPGSMLTV
jgi:hypothetical protein